MDFRENRNQEQICQMTKDTYSTRIDTGGRDGIPDQWNHTKSFEKSPGGKAKEELNSAPSQRNQGI